MIYRRGNVKKVYCPILPGGISLSHAFLTFPWSMWHPAGDQSPAPGPCCGTSTQEPRGSLGRPKYGGGPVPPGHYSSHEGLLRTTKTPGHPHPGEARWADHPPSGYKAIERSGCEPWAPTGVEGNESHPTACHTSFLSAFPVCQTKA